MPRLTAESKMDVLRKTARIIGESFDIQVVFRGDQAYTDGRTIVVPALAENAPDDLVEAIIGFIDHEVGHILHTDFAGAQATYKEYADAAGREDPRLHPMTNAIEDIRQEWLMGEMYRGVGLNLERTMVWVMEKVVAQWSNPSMSDFFKVSALMMMRAKARLGVPRAQEFYDDLAGPMHPIVQRCEDELRAWYRLPSTVEAVHAAKRILDMLDAMNEAPPPPKQQQQQSGKGGSKSKGDPKETASGSRDEEAGQGSGQPADGEPGESEGKGESGKGGKPEGEDEGEGQGAKDEEEGESEGSPGSEGEDGEGEGDGSKPAQADDAGDVEGGQGDPLGPDQMKILANTRSQRYDPNQIGSLHDFGAAAIVQSATGSVGHRPFTTEMDRVMPPVGEASLAQYSAIADKVKNTTHVVSGLLKRRLRTLTKARTLRQRSSGNISLSNMAQVRAHQPNIFQVKRQGRDLDTYVHLIVDHSGSMSGRKMTCAAQTCVVLADALDKVGIDFGISGFTAGWGCTRGMTLDEMALHEKLIDEVHSGKADDFERTDPIIEYVYKTADESYAKAKPRLALMEKQWMGCNGDGDSIYKIARAVAKRREARKILIVLSDGMPAISQGRRVSQGEADAYLKKVTAMIEQVPGMEAIGIGIMTDAVKAYYRRHVIVHKPEDLAGDAMGALSDALLGRLKPLEEAK